MAETTSGIGTGSAQVFAPSKAADLFINEVDRIRAERDKRGLEKQKKIEEANKELSGKFDDLYKSKIFDSRDTDIFYSKIDGINQKWNGRGHEMYKDPKVQNEFMKDINDIRSFAMKSAAIKEELSGIRKAMYEGDPDKFTDEQREELNTIATTPGYGIDEGEIDFSRFLPEKNLPNIVDVLDKNMPMQKFTKETPVIGKTTVGGDPMLVQGSNVVFDENGYRDAATKLTTSSMVYQQALQKQWGDLAKTLTEQRGEEVTPLDAMLDWKLSQKQSLEKRDRSYSQDKSEEKGGGFYQDLMFGGKAENDKYRFIYTPPKEGTVTKNMWGGTTTTGTPATIDFALKNPQDNKTVTIPRVKNGRTSNITIKPTQAKQMADGTWEVIAKEYTFDPETKRTLESQREIAIPYSEIKGGIDTHLNIDLDAIGERTQGTVTQPPQQSTKQPAKKVATTKTGIPLPK